MIDLLKKTLNKVIREKSLVGIYSTMTNSNEFIVGLIQGYTSGILTFISISSEAQPQDVYILKLNAITSIETNTKYLSSLNKLLNDKEIRNSLTALKGKVIKRGIRKYFEENLKQKKVITITFGKDKINSLSGYLLGYDNKYFCLKKINGFGEEDGIAVGKIKEVMELKFGYSEQVMLQYFNTLD